MASIAAISQQLASLGFERRAGRSGIFYNGELKAGLVDVPVELEILDLDFVDLPIVRVDESFLIEHKLRGHMSEGNALCYTDTNLLVLNSYNPIGSIRAVFELCERTLRELLHGNPNPAIRAEVTAYWKGNAYYVINDLSGYTKAAIGLIEYPNGKSIRVIASDEEAMTKWARRMGLNAEYKQDLLVAHLNADIPVPPHLSNLKEASDWLNGITGQESWPFDKIDSKHAPAVLIIGTNGIVGFKAEPNTALQNAERGKGFRKSSIPELWKSQADATKIERFYGCLSTHSEIVSRSMDREPPCKGKKICIIGSGTIGGYLARMLVQNGAGWGQKLTLVDNQVFLPENSGRHLLGFSAVGKMKAEALKQTLESDFPGSDCEAITISAHKVWGQFREYDLIIDATGSERFSSALNRFAQDMRLGKQYPPIIYSMIFGNGTAVQSFLDKGGERDACYQCLRPDYEKPWRFYPMKGKPSDIEFAVRPCSIGGYTPFGVEASLSAATLTLRQTLDFFSGIRSSTLRTHVIDDKQGNGIPNKTISQAPSCPACVSNL